MKRVFLSIIMFFNLTIIPLANAKLIDSLRLETINGKKIIIHKADKGETLNLLLRRYGGNVDQFKRLNATSEIILSEGNIYKLNYTFPSATQVRNTQKRNYSSTNSVSDVNSIVVYKGLTLYSIAKKYRHSVENLKSWNNLNSNLIYPGQTIYFREMGSNTNSGSSVSGNEQHSREVPSEKIVVDDNEIYSVVDQAAEYVGGSSELSRFLSRNIKYPNEASRANVSGKILVGFVVNKNGSISDVAIQNKLGYGLDEEAVRVVKAMPNWQAGKKGGKNINSKFTLPISFVLQE